MHPRILIFDDHEDGLLCSQCLGTAWMLRADMHREMASTTLPHATFFDLAIPKHGGFEIAEQLLRADLPRFELFAMSGYCDREMQERCAKVGFDRFLAKPIDVEALRSLVCDLKAGMQLKIVE